MAGPQSLVVKGGNSRLPMAVSKLLKGDLLLGREAVGIASEVDGGRGPGWSTCRNRSARD